MLELNNIYIRLGSFELKDLSFHIKRGEYFVILGESGVGKSVLLETIAGIMTPESGALHLKGKDITTLPTQKRGLGLVYQDQALFPHMDVKSNIAFPLQNKSLSKNDINERVNKLAEDVGIIDLLHRNPETLSLGESQRVALARTMAAEPEILLLDEPLASLDAQAKSEMRSLLRRINASGQTVIHVTHDYTEAIALATKVSILESGKISQTGTSEEIFKHPKSEFIANFIGIRNFCHGELLKKSDDLGIFKTNELEFEIATDANSGKGNMILRSEDIAIFESASQSSASNHFEGKVTDIEPAHLGVEITIDIGIKLSSLITSESMKRLNLKIGKRVCCNFKASAARFLAE